MMIPPKTIKWFHAESDGAHNFSGPIQDRRDEDRVRRAYQPGRKGIVSLTIFTFTMNEDKTEVIR